MKTFSDEPTPERGDTIYVRLSEYVIATEGETLIAYGIGSCVAIICYDPKAGVGGLANAVLPDQSRGAGETTGKYVDTAIGALLQDLTERGANIARLEAYLAGGSEMITFDALKTAVGQQNVDAATDRLEAFGVPIVSSDVGGDYGRVVVFDTDEGTIRVETAENGVRTLR